MAVLTTTIKLVYKKFINIHSRIYFRSSFLKKANIKLSYKIRTYLIFVVNIFLQKININLQCYKTQIILPKCYCH